MVAHLVRLKLALLRNGLRRSPWQVVGMVVGLLYGLGAAAVAVLGVVALGFVDVELRTAALVLGGSLLVLGWWLIPLVAFGVDSTLDPRRFATFGVPRRDLLVGLALAGLVGVPGLATAVVALSTAASWWRSPAAVVGALVGAVLGIAVCVTGSRATTTVLAPVVARRRVRELVTVLAILPLIFLGPIMTGVARGAENLVGFAPLVRVASWTPVGAPWAIAPAVADGDWGGAVARIAICLATVVLAVRVWAWALERSLSEPPSSGEQARARGLGWFGRFPATPTGAVAARAATYWVRDPRYAMAAAIVPVLPLLLAISAPDGALVLVAGPAAALTLGWTISADVAYDGTAFWTHVASPLRGAADRWGRVVVAGSLGLLVVAVMVVGTAWYAGRLDALPALLGASLGLLLTALGVASVVSAMVVYPVQLPGENPFGTKQGASAAAFTSQMVGFAAVAGLASPALVLGAVSVVQRSAVLGWVTLAVGVVLGAVLLVVGVRIGGSVLDRRAPDLLQRMRAFA